MQATLGYEKSSCADFQDKPKVVQALNKLNIITIFKTFFSKDFYCNRRSFSRVILSTRRRIIWHFVGVTRLAPHPWVTSSPPSTMRASSSRIIFTTGDQGVIRDLAISWQYYQTSWSDVPEIKSGTQDSFKIQLPLYNRPSSFTQARQCLQVLTYW